jgi:hypothetical protein
MSGRNPELDDWIANYRVALGDTEPSPRKVRFESVGRAVGLALGRVVKAARAIAAYRFSARKGAQANPEQIVSQRRRSAA